MPLIGATYSIGRQGLAANALHFCGLRWHIPALGTYCGSARLPVGQESRLGWMALCVRAAVSDLERVIDRAGR